MQKKITDCIPGDIIGAYLSDKFGTYTVFSHIVTEDFIEAEFLGIIRGYALLSFDVKYYDRKSADIWLVHPDDRKDYPLLADLRITHAGWLHSSGLVDDLVVVTTSNEITPATIKSPEIEISSATIAFDFDQYNGIK